jgi:hypothetical protein
VNEVTTRAKLVGAIFRDVSPAVVTDLHGAATEIVSEASAEVLPDRGAVACACAGGPAPPLVGLDHSVDEHHYRCRGGWVVPRKDRRVGLEVCAVDADAHPARQRWIAVGQPVADRAVEYPGESATPRCAGPGLRGPGALDGFEREGGGAAREGDPGAHGAVHSCRGRILRRSHGVISTRTSPRRAMAL